jgi:hypothetical protein
MVLSWIVVSSVWTSFCLLDAFATWSRFRSWRATVVQCERESLLLLRLLVDEIRKARERMGRDSRPRDVIPDVDKPQS